MVIFVIKEIRLEKNLTVEYVSKMSGISQSYYSDIENNKEVNPSIELLEKIANVLGVSIKKIFFADSEIESIRNQLHRYIKRYGINHPKTLNYSQIIDTLLNAKNDKNKQK